MTPELSPPSLSRLSPCSSLVLPWSPSSRFPPDELAVDTVLSHITLPTLYPARIPLLISLLALPLRLRGAATADSHQSHRNSSRKRAGSDTPLADAPEVKRGSGRARGGTGTTTQSKKTPAANKVKAQTSDNKENITALGIDSDGARRIWPLFSFLVSVTRPPATPAVTRAKKPSSSVVSEQKHTPASNFRKQVANSRDSLDFWDRPAKGIT
ncbi:hypothetical protein R3P38DRAFT_3204749 [Favolaschia claudopus]|uniref:Uncharacterized protein n=1 Tax=Favolaschia claudopus TaxID=2862362 RepID=A0AAW0ASN0_9AGAR